MLFRSFLLNGPNTILSHNSMIYIIESQVDYILQALDAAAGGTIEATPEAQDAWVAHGAALAEGTLFDQADSWYIGANIPGKPRVFMPYLGGVDVYQSKCREVAENGYRSFALGASDPVAVTA